MTAEPLPADQAAVDAEVDEILDDTIEDLPAEGAILFLGQKFGIRKSRPAMAMMTWFDAVDRGLKLGTIEGYKFILGQLKSTIVPEDWARFEAHALETEADVSQLNTAMDCGIAVVINRPTVSSSASADGRAATDPSSSASSSSPESSTPEPSPRARQIAEQAAEMVPVTLAAKRALKAKRAKAAGRPA